MMLDNPTEANTGLPSAGRRWLWLALLLCVLPIAAYAFQVGVLRRMFVPWYIPMLSTAGVAFVVMAILQRRTWPRLIMLALLVAFAGLEWFAMTTAVRTPEYVGPAKPGAGFPAFVTKAADGRQITEQELQQGETTVLVFYRGRW